MMKDRWLLKAGTMVAMRVDWMVDWMVEWTRSPKAGMRTTAATKVGWMVDWKRSQKAVMMAAAKVD